jgi:hypothetical protein
MKQAVIKAMIRHNLKPENRISRTEQREYVDWSSLRKINKQWVVNYRKENQTTETRQLGQTLKEAYFTVIKWS